MNKIFLTMLSCFFVAFTYTADAQEKDNKDGKKETEEIIIRKKGEKDMHVTIQINGEEILVNGKPLIEFKEDGISINRKKIMVTDGNRFWFGDGGSGADMGAFSMTEDGNAKKRAFLGVSTEKDEAGARIESVTEGSAAEKAGLQKGDIITKLNGKSISGPQELQEVVTSMKPGEEVKVGYQREGKNKSVKATLGERSDRSIVRSFSMTSPDGSFKTFTVPAVPGNGEWKEMFPNQDFNAFERNMEKFENFDMDRVMVTRKQKLGIRIQDTEDGTGVKVLDVEDSSAAAKAGMMKDDIITEIAGVKVSNTDDAREQLMENSEKTSYTMKARRNGSEMTFNIKIPRKLKTANL